MLKGMNLTLVDTVEAPLKEAIVSHDLSQERKLPQSVTAKKIIINISGQNFVSTVGTLLKYPESRLGKLVRKEPSGTNYFFESDAEIFKEILKFYLSGELHCPKSTCYSDFLSHLEFWEIDTGAVSDCCFQDMSEEKNLDRQFEYFNKKPKPKFKNANGDYLKSYYVWCFLTDPCGKDTKFKAGAKIWSLFYFLFTISFGSAEAISTVPSLWKGGNDFRRNRSDEHISLKMSCEEFQANWIDIAPKSLDTVAYISFALYATEVWIRFLTCPSKRAFWKTIHVVDMIISIMECVCYALIAIVYTVILPNPDRYPTSGRWCVSASFALVLKVWVGQMRYLRLLSYAYVYSGLKVLLITLYRSWKEILLLVVLLAMSVLIFGPLVYFSILSTIGQGLPLNSIPSAYWFVIVTMTTVGYGDMYPTTVSGYLATVVVMIVGLTITALPVAIVGGNFSVVYEHNKKRERAEKERDKREKSSLCFTKSCSSIRQQSS
ncbi:potassium voltage-gated channel subfamily B member 2-like [Watersipora subatra]|uniref:potassium voltage-gated channel subfamily B member 2-like n=1 Tax=Watersipora subatra TaxID=2589382 RepID=UPI00355BC695